MNLYNQLQQRRLQTPYEIATKGLGKRKRYWNLESWHCQRISRFSSVNVHQGCVNRLAWNGNGSILGSVSDDLNIALVEVSKFKYLQDNYGHANALKHASTILPTPHRGNIFGICFLNQEQTIVTGARDAQICVTDLGTGKNLATLSCHSSSVKQIISTPLDQNVFYSASSDGKICRHDLRFENTCRDGCENVIVNLNGPMETNAPNEYRTALWQRAMESTNFRNRLPFAITESQWALESFSGVEIKAIAINPTRPEFLATSTSDGLVRMYDLRRCTSSNENDARIHLAHSMPILDKVFLPRHFWDSEFMLFSSHLAWSPNGQTLAVTYERDSIYLFNPFEPAQGVYNDKHKEAFIEKVHNPSKTRVVADLEHHLSSCCIASCREATIKHLSLMLLERNCHGDYKLANCLCREAHLINPSDPIHLYRRIQACILLRDFSCTTRLCKRGMGMYPKYKFQFKRIFTLCLMLLNEENNKPDIISSLTCIAKSREIIAPVIPPEALPGTKTANANDVASDDEVDPSIRASFRYSIQGWRGWPSPGMCQALLDFENCQGGGGGTSSTPPNLTGNCQDEHYQQQQHRGAREDQGTISLGYVGACSIDNVRVQFHLTTVLDKVHNCTSPDNAAESRHFDFTSVPLKEPIDDGFIHSQWPMKSDYLQLQEELESTEWRPCGNGRRLWGHLNSGTDIAEVGFWGNGVVVSGCADGSIVLYNLASGQIINVLQGCHQENVNCVQVNPQGTLLATSGIDNFITLWELDMASDTMDQEVLDNVVGGIQAHRNPYLEALELGEIRESVLAEMLENPQGCIVQ
ncbi:bifunctional WD40 repeat/WD40-YVTN repeat-like-containing domain superfamily/DDB1- and CUL4-associated factor 8-like/WD40-repeat-containing domain superfamily/WD40 repeat [Babesia duncani]|uniref:Bifunctional WD40 repeat/WD40-YVTN repeat-like-containing domain superfamily/DDB1- and CUL4-associated factor 8-like/WD40-repeat-containing domain superfamily/WD40 repeat n=1 Tax=Babesia duncani TaxID=323732 RepID=A0AAD9UPT7_9APIC|nr:bifunctional WD40 repeat/WD40-YVTN repeat-like-containing domain superfamily/DDB1- and CUL4-associated factor 8-like/WD40-repeat-containing domain superfamily/WD40 repeat [Babesia duncani]